MSLDFWKRYVGAFGIILAAGTILSGCGQSADQNKSAETKTTAVVDDGGWWCAEHGVPEEECARCDASLVAKFKEAGDWCEEHNRPESQCFLCSPARFDKFAARYEAKFGARPPQYTE
jgi:hypothetical protein